jgi:hypothetical protein
MDSCALGLRVHSGWAALVAIAVSGRDDSSPRVVARSRVEVADPAIEGSRQPYHQAEDMPLPRAARYLTRCERASFANARKGLAAALESLPPGTPRPRRCALLLASGRPLPELAQILASHALIHTADGEHFRDAFAAAARECGLDVIRVRERDVTAELARQLEISPESLERRVAGWRKDVGPPWTADQKLASIAAWSALAGAALA